MASLAQSGRFELGPVHEILKAEFAASSATEAEVVSVIATCRQDCGYTADPHTACGLVAAQRKSHSDTPTVILATASPAKFPDVMEQVTGQRPLLPSRLAHLLSNPERTQLLPNNLAAVQEFVAASTRSHRPGSRKDNVA